MTVARKKSKKQLQREYEKTHSESLFAHDYLWEAQQRLNATKKLSSESVSLVRPEVRASDFGLEGFRRVDSFIVKEAERIARYQSSMSPDNKRRKSLKVQPYFFDTYKNFSVHIKRPNDNICSALTSWYLRSSSSNVNVSRSDSWAMLLRAKSYLARRILSDDFSEVSDSRREWTKKRFPAQTLLDLFPGLKYSYSSMLPATAIARRRGVDVSDVDTSCVRIVSYGNHSQFEDLSRSHSIRFDPIDSPKELYRYRLRVQECLNWARSVGLVPVMMTLTVYHRWHPLRKLVSVLKKAWNYFFTGTRAAKRRAEKMGLFGYIRRMEETLNKDKGFNSGWHPHYHVILFVPQDRLNILSIMEDELRDAWYKAVLRYFEAEVGEPIPDAYAHAFRMHGLVLSRESTSSSPLRVVDNGAYMAKIMGYDPWSVYGGDTEITANFQKNSFIPFDLLREDTAENNDLWVEYVLAMKGEFNFYFSRSLVKGMRDSGHFNDTNEGYNKNFTSSDATVTPAKKVIAQLDFSVYRFFYKAFGFRDFLKNASEGFQSLAIWCRDKYREIGFPMLSLDARFLPHRPFDDFSLAIDVEELEEFMAANEKAKAP